MQLQELNALLTSSDLFAISPTPIDRPMPYGHESRKREACPLGLVKATVLESSHPWVEQVAFGCTGATSPIDRKTGVLVRVRLPDLEAEGVEVDRLLSSQYAEHVADTKTVVQMVVSRRAVLMPWSAYQPTRDHRRKAQRDAARRDERMQAAVSAIGAEEGRWSSSWDRDRQTRLYKAEDATVVLTLPRAEELARLLGVEALADAV